jgi:hypothetical protein
MFAKIFLTLALFYFPFTGFAKIVETARIADVLPFIDDDTWVLVDLDNTLYQAAQALGHVDWFHDEVVKKMQTGMTHEQAGRSCYPDFVKTQKTCKVKPVEEGFLPLLLKLQQRGIVIVNLSQ